MKHKIFFISELLSTPFDEGAKIMAYSLFLCLMDKSELLAVTNYHNNTGDLQIKKVPLNKFFLNNELFSLFFFFLF